MTTATFYEFIKVDGLVKSRFLTFHEIIKVGYDAKSETGTDEGAGVRQCCIQTRQIGKGRKPNINLLRTRR